MIPNISLEFDTVTNASLAGQIRTEYTKSSILYDRILRSHVIPLKDPDTSFSVDINSTLKSLNPNRTGLFAFFTFLGWGDAALPIIFVVCGPIARKFCTEIDNQSSSSNMEKNVPKINDVIDNDIIIVRKLAEDSKESKKSLKRTYFKIAAALKNFT